MTAEVTEQDLPRIGRSYRVARTDGSRVLVVLHHRLAVEGAVTAHPPAPPHGSSFRFTVRLAHTT